MLTNNLVVSVVVFIAFAVILIVALCLITRYFNKKLQKALNDETQIYSMIDQIKASNEQQQYDEYMTHCLQMETPAKGKNNGSFEIQMSSLKNPINVNQNIYSTNRLKRRLEGEVSVQSPMSKRSNISMKSFRAQRLDSFRTGNHSNRSKSTVSDQGDESSRGLLKENQQKKKINFATHQFVSKIVAYNQEGVLIVENKVLSLIKTEDKMDEKRSVAVTRVRPHQQSFKDILQVYGFEEEQFAAFKYQTKVEIPHMKFGEYYPVSSLKTAQSKQQIDFPQFYHLKDLIEQI